MRRNKSYSRTCFHGEITLSMRCPVGSLLHFIITRSTRFSSVSIFSLQFSVQLFRLPCVKLTNHIHNVSFLVVMCRYAHHNMYIVMRMHVHDVNKRKRA